MWDKQNGPIVRTNFQQPDPNAQSGVVNSAFIQAGCVPSARQVLATKPTAADTTTIGGHVFKFVSSLGAADTFTQIKLLSTAALTTAALVHAINGVTDSNVVKGTTPFSKSVVADLINTADLRIRLADAQGGNPIAGVSPSIALSASMTASGNKWNCSNLNVSGKDPSSAQSALVAFTVEATMVTAGSYDLELPFTPTIFTVQVLSSSGVLRSSNEAVTISGNHLHFVMAGGASPNLQAGDVVTVRALA